MNLLEPKHFNFLKEVSIFEDLSENDLKQITKLIEPKEIKENEVVFSRLEKEQGLR